MESGKIYPNVEFGDGVKIQEFVSIGVPPVCKKEGDLKTTIGKDSLIRSHSVIYAGNRTGECFQTGHSVLIRENNTIGSNVSIGSNTVVERDSVIGNNVRLHSNVFVPEYTTIEDGAWIGPNVVMTNTPHPMCKNAKDCMKGPVIRSGAKIGANSTILPMIVVGRNALVGAGSVVTDNVPEGCVVAGNPAKIINKVGGLKCRSGIRDRPYKELP